jgi:hypothetical protein
VQGSKPSVKTLTATTSSTSVPGPDMVGDRAECTIGKGAVIVSSGAASRASIPSRG